MASMRRVHRDSFWCAMAFRQTVKLPSRHRRKSSIEQDKEALLSNSKTNLFSSWSQVTKIVAAVDRMNVERHGFKRNAPRKFSALAIGQSLGESSALLRIFGLGKQALARGTGHTQKEQSL